MAGKGGDHPYATGLLYIIGAVIAVFLIGRFTHTDLLGLARDESNKLSRLVGGASASTADLKKLKVAAAGSKDGYGTAKFPAADSDLNGCATRDDVLARDLDDVKKHGSCTVTAGTLADPYTGRTVKSPAGVAINHVVPLPIAWRSGAAGWDQDKRTRFANDEDTLLAVDAGAAKARGDKGPDKWRPRQAFQCAFAQKYVSVARDYDLTVTKPEHDALAAMLGTC